jgi:hypothetical protein
MLSRRLGQRLKSERGTTLVELLGATSAGIIVMGTLATLIIVVLHGTARVSARVDATQRARVAVTRVIEELHSGCISPKAAPVYPKSTGTTLYFIHSVGSQGIAVAPIPTKTKIEYSEGTLTQYDWPGTGVYPSTTWPTETAANATKTVLLTKMAPIAPSSSIFTYYGSTNGSVGEIIPGTEGLTSIQAVGVIEVRLGLSASPSSSPIADTGSTTSIKDSAFLRLTPPSYNEKATAPPCQ